MVLVLSIEFPRRVLRILLAGAVTETIRTMAGRGGPARDRSGAPRPGGQATLPPGPLLRYGLVVGPFTA